MLLFSVDKKATYFKSLDGLRGLAFLMVVIAHTGQRYKDFYIAGKIGVVVFFILSAFLLIYHFLSESDKYKRINEWTKYALKRIFRIYPMYIFVLLIELLISGFSVEKLLRHIFLLEATKHYWTIPVEMTFYVIAPILGLFFVYILKRSFTRMIGVVSILIFGYVLIYDQIVYFFRTGNANESAIIFYMIPFLLGVALAVIQNNKNIVQRLTRLSIVISTLMLIILFTFVIYSIPYSYNIIIKSNYGRAFLNIFIFYSLTFSAIILLLINTKSLFRVLFESKLLRFIGSISYSGYLIHILVLEWVYSLSLPDYLSLVAVLTLTVALSFVTFSIIEKPFISAGHRFSGSLHRHLSS